MGPGTRLDDVLVRADLDGVETWAAAASPEERRSARAWVTRSTAHLAEGSLDQDFDLWLRRWWVVLLLACSVEAPAVAAGHPGWRWVHAYQDPDGVGRLDRVLANRERAWVESFVPRAAELADGDLSLLFPVLRRLVLDHGLPVPDGRLFLQGWVGSVEGEAELSRTLAEDPLVPEVVHRLLPSGLLHRLPNLPDAAPTLVEAGRLDRDRVLAESFDLLSTTTVAVGTQRALAKLLAALGLRADELPGGLPFAQGLMATCHGSVGALVLPLALDLLRTGDELVELAATIGARREKAQKTTLLRALGTAEVQARAGVPAVLEALDLLRTDDTQLVASIDRLHARLGGVEEDLTRAPLPAAPAGLWSHPLPAVATPAPQRIGEWTGLVEAARRGLAHELRHPSTFARPDISVVADTLLAAIVREAAARGADSTHAALRVLVRSAEDQRGVLGEALVDWYAAPDLAAYHRAFADVGVFHRTDTGHMARPYSLKVPATAFHYLRAQEALLRLGRCRSLLSTPDHTDHSLGLDSLVARIEENQGTTVGVLDLAQALLRLRPTQPSEASRLDGLTLAVDDEVTPTGRATGLGDAVEVVRVWVGSGGLPPLRPTVRNDIWTHGLSLPLPDGLLDALPHGFLNEDPRLYRALDVIRTVPGWPDASLMGRRALTDAESHYHQLAEFLLGRTPPLALHSWDLLLADLVERDPGSRERAVATCLQLMAEQRFDGEGFARAAVDRLEAGALVLTTLVPVWELMCREGALPFLWRTFLRTADAACTAARRPAGTPELLRLLQELVTEVPDPEVPPGVRQLAEGRGTSKSHHEARELVRRVDQLRAG